VEGLLAGEHRSTRHDFSPEPVAHRPYQPGDDPRRVDWLAAGRTDRLLVRETAAATNLTAVLVLDASGSMAYRGGRRPSKFEYARQLTAALAYLTAARRDAVGLIVHDAAVQQVVPPRATSKHLLGLMRRLDV